MQTTHSPKSIPMALIRTFQHGGAYLAWKGTQLALEAIAESLHPHASAKPGTARKAKKKTKARKAA